jgi:hypothetical protein
MRDSMAQKGAYDRPALLFPIPEEDYCIDCALPFAPGDRLVPFIYGMASDKQWLVAWAHMVCPKPEEVQHEVESTG